MGEVSKDVKHALQMFTKNPGFTLAAVSVSYTHLTLPTNREV